MNLNLQFENSELHVSWTSNVSTSTLFQVYLDHVLAWQGYSLFCVLPMLSSERPRNTRVDIGSISPEDAFTDYASILNRWVIGGDRARLAWVGGTFLDTSCSDNIAGYKVLGGLESTSDATRAELGNISAYPGSWISDGYGLGYYGQGGFGKSATLYSWVSEPLSPGTWSFVIFGYNLAGDAGIASSPVSLTVISPPLPLSSDSLVLSFFGPDSRQCQLTWTNNLPN